jgi:hypothetical protein
LPALTLVFTVFDLGDITNLPGPVKHELDLVPDFVTGFILAERPIVRHIFTLISLPAVGPGAIF